MKHLGDITKLSGYVVPAVDVVIGGSPCQGLSVAGKQAGLKDERSGLFIEQIRLVKEMRKADAARGKTNDAIRPRYMVWENVPGAFSSNKGRDFEAVLEETVRVAEPKAPPCSCPCERMAHKRMPHGRRMERCVEERTMPEKSEFDKALGELYDLTEWEDAEAAIRELHARGPEIERLYLDSKILPGELRALVMVSNCLEREFIHRQLATGQPLHMNVL